MNKSDLHLEGGAKSKRLRTQGDKKEYSEELSKYSMESAKPTETKKIIVQDMTKRVNGEKRVKHWYLHPGYNCV